MKKRILSALLVLCMAVSLFAGLTVSASADTAAFDIKSYATLYTVEKGDTLTGICSKKLANLKIAYNDVKAGIQTANGLSEVGLNRLTVGQKIWIPTSKLNSAEIVKNATRYNAAGTATGAAKGTGAAATGTPTVNIATTDVISYTVKSGDTLGKICVANKLNYFTSKQAIMDLNNWSSAAKLNRIYPGQVIKLPSSDAAASSIASKVNTARQTTAVNTGTAAGTATNSNTDAVAFYLVKHQMASGETIKGVCSAFGVPYSATVSSQIQKLNGIKNLSAVKAGATYWFPSNYANGTGYAVYRHTVVGGDTVSNLCTANGLNFNKVSALIQGLNPTTDINKIKRGQTLYILGTAAGKTNVTTGTAPNANGVNVVVGSGTGTGTVPGSGTPTGPAYSLKAVSASNGSIYFTVGGAKVTSAAAGSTVMVVGVPNSGYALESAVYQYTYSGSAFSKEVLGGTFTMPASNVSVTPKFSAPHKVTFTAMNNSTLVVSVNGVNISSGAAVATGAQVAFRPTPKNGYTLDGAPTAGGTPLTGPDSQGIYYFKMPNNDVNISYNIVAGATKAISVTTTNGTVAIRCAGTDVQAASEGSQIILTPTPWPGYALDSLTVNSGGVTLVPNKDGTYSFTMGNAAVALEAKFSQGYDIEKTIGTNCKVTSIKVGGIDTTHANSNQTVNVQFTAEYGCKFKDLRPIMPDGTTCPNWAVNEKTGAGSFTMPQANVKFIAVAAGLSIEKTVGTNCKVTSVKVGGADVSFANPGDVVQVQFTHDEGYSFTDLKPLKADGKVCANWSVDPISGLGSFTMPDSNVHFTAVATGYTVEKTVGTNCRVYSIKVGGKDATLIPAGSTVDVQFVVEDGYHYTDVWPLKADNSVCDNWSINASTGVASFTMPYSNVHFRAIAEK